ncbi:unnamed protein product [Pelagomonas calceolata]|uniref:Uncharacterized protein n=1 Tax=Pelagomonas calceolata TaxID=35677 RepID=A0A8J2T310_9STRA|nr:unnamed protein product [Pelagomonas calceolata]
MALPGAVAQAIRRGRADTVRRPPAGARRAEAWPLRELRRVGFFSTPTSCRPWPIFLCRASLAPEHSPVASSAGCLTAGTASCASRSASSVQRPNALIQRITLASDAVVQAASAAVRLDFCPAC